MFSIEDLYRAYRKAKHEAFADATQPCSLEFVRYEQALHKNLLRLKTILSSKRKPWYKRKDIVSGFAYLPKSIENSDDNDGDKAHYSSGDQTVDWVKRFGKEKETANAEFRLVIIPTVDFQIISALWVMFVGRSYDAALNDEVAYGNRARKPVSLSIADWRISDDSYALFQPYFSGYKRWRENGLEAMRKATASGERVVAITMDARSYYHSISPRFLLSQSFLQANSIELTSEQIEFTQGLIGALELWHRHTPEHHSSPVGAVPVGLSASKIIANVLLAEFDRAVLSRLKCRYYGRYVDDLFLVVAEAEGSSANEIMQWVRERLDGYVVLDRPKGGSAGLRLTLSYLDESKIVFAGSKQKIFVVDGEQGGDLVRQISEQIRKASSEYRLLPSLVEVNQVLTGALLASTDASIEADTLRKAEAMSVRRHGLSIATRNLDGYARDVEPEAWNDKRHNAYGLVLRHVVTPVGLFNYAKYITRVFGVMIASADWNAAEQLLDKVNDVLIAIREGIDAGHMSRLESVADVYRRGFLEAAISASTVAKFSFDLEFRRLLRRLDPKRQVFASVTVTKASIEHLSRRFLLADVGRRPYKDYWYNENPELTHQPRLPDVAFIKQLWSLLTGFKRHIRRPLRDPYWPAFAFATRPPTLSEMSLMMPGLMREPGGLAKALLAVRGAGVPASSVGIELVRPAEQWVDCFVPHPSRNKKIKVAVSSFLTTDKQWKAAIKGRPDLSIGRYERLTYLVNSIIRRIPDVDYVALPESSIPFSWAFSISKSLARVGVSFICGLESTPKRKQYRNEALVSLATNYGGYRSSLVFRQPKMQLAHREALHIRKSGLRYASPALPEGRPIYVHGDFLFSVLLCSDLTNIDNRRALQGEIDALFVLEWNPDVDTFSYLVESACHDLHAPVVQVNNRLYGDSRVRIPYKKDYLRDAVRIKGGDTDFYVVASFDHHALRLYQFKPKVGDKTFKPLPIGYRLSSRRKPLAGR